MYKLKQLEVSKQINNNVIENMMDNCISSTVVTTNAGARGVNVDIATPYIYPNDITNNCVCPTAYENIGKYWYCRADK